MRSNFLKKRLGQWDTGTVAYDRNKNNVINGLQAFFTLFFVIICNYLNYNVGEKPICS